MRFRHTAKFAVSPSNLKNLTASPGVKRARKPSVYFFGTFFVQAKKVHIVPHIHGSREGAHTLRVLFWAVRPPAILADEQAKIMNLSFAKPCPFVRHKRNRTKAVRPPAIYADEQALRGIYGALPQTPPAFLKKAGEKQCLTAEHPTHSVRAAAKRRCNTRERASENNKFIFRENMPVFVP